MTDLSGLTPAEQVQALALRIGDTIECRHDYDNGDWTEVRRQLLAVGKTHCLWDSWIKTKGRQRWIHEGENCHHLYDAPWRKISSDPSIDPAEPLRRELREAYEIIQAYHHVGVEIASGFPAEVEEWLARNAAFRAGEVGE